MMAGIMHASVRRQPGRVTASPLALKARTRRWRCTIGFGSRYSGDNGKAVTPGDNGKTVTPGDNGKTVTPGTTAGHKDMTNKGHGRTKTWTNKDID
jgi:hypothetical protein